jgi:hypothetical protein
MTNHGDDAYIARLAREYVAAQLDADGWDKPSLKRVSSAHAELMAAVEAESRVAA